MRTFLHAATFLSGIFFLTACGSDFDDTAPGEPGGPAGSGGAVGSDAASGASGSSPEDPGGGSGGTAEGSAGHSGDGTDAGVPEADASGPDAPEPDAGPDSATPDAAPDQDPSCPTGWADCDADPANGCEINVTGDPDHCGACGHACGGDHASATCEQGACVLSCDTGFDDCDGVASNGCEADLSTTDNCLACGVVCAGSAHATATCGASGCGHDCVAGWDDCDSNPANGCEAPLQTDANHCGACGQACPTRPNASPSCEAGQCGFTCLASFEDCDGQVGNGCEANLQSSTSHCGGCGKTCGTAAGVASCTGGACSIACNVDWADCDGVNANGCETSTATTANCGACGNACGAANGSASCGAGECQLTCQTGFGDCDSVNANGCEVDLTTDAKNCGQCGRSCLGSTCEDGLCVPKVVAGARDFTILDGTLYTTAGPRLSKVMGGGMLTKVLYESDDEIWEPVVTDGRAYFFDGYPNTKIRAVSTGTMQFVSTIVSSVSSYPVGLTYDNGMVYWRSLHRLFKADVTQTNAQGTVVAAIPTDVEELHVSGGFVYWASPGQGIQRVSIAGGTATSLYSGENQPADMVFDGSRLFWVNGIGRVRTALGDAISTVATGLGALRSITVDGDYLYVSNDSQIWRVTKAGGEKRLLTDPGSLQPDDLVVDGSWLYWIVRGQTDQVYRVAK